MNAADNGRLIEQDNRLPGLFLVLSPAQVHEHLRQRGIIDSRQSVELLYVRYKPGRRALALMNLADSAGNERPIVISAHDQAGWNKLNTTGRGSEVESQGGVLLPEHQCSIETFGSDRQLRQIGKLHHIDRTQSILQRITGISLPATEAWELKTLAYKPRRRFVVKASSTVDQIVVKFYTKEDFASAKERSLGVANSGLQALSPQVIACNDRYSAIAYKWMEGDTLSSQLLRTKSWDRQPSIALHQAGELLAAWQQSATPALRFIQEHHGGFTQNALRSLIDDMLWLEPRLKSSLESILQSLQPTLHALSEGKHIIHGDFYAKQLIVQRDAMQLIDFDEIGRGHRYQDLGTFVGQMYWNALREGSDCRLLQLQVESFIAGYSHRMGDLDEVLLHASIAIGILRCMPHPFRRGLPDWTNKMQQMFEWSENWMPNRTHVNKRPSRSGTTFNTGDMKVASELPAAECVPYLDCEKIATLIEQMPNPTDGKRRTPRVVRSRLVRHKAGRRLLVEYQLRWAEPAQFESWIGKARIGKAIDIKVLQLHRDLQSLRSVDIIVPRVIGLLPELNMWLQEKLIGPPVTPESATTVHGEVGRALAALHDTSATVSKTHSITDELVTLRKQHAEWLPTSSPLYEASQAVLAFADQRAAALTHTKPVLLHRDFYFDQLLCSTSGIALLDFDLSAMGPAELDIGNYVAHLDEFAIRFPQHKEQCERAAEAFLTSYRLHRPQIEFDSIAVWRLLSLARLAAISQRIPDRTPWTQAILKACRP